MDLLATGYDSSSDEGGDGVAHGADSDDDSLDQASGGGSIDSADVRAAEAEARLRDYGESGAGAAQSRPATMLPSALDAFDTVEGPPKFLDPEATRPLATSALHGMFDPGPSTLSGPAKVKQQPGKDFDISRLAPPLKGQAKPGGTDKRELPAAAVIEGKAKRYKTEDGPEATQQYTAAQIAMMGGNVSDKLAERVPTKPMEVSEFLNKGVGAAQLPRKGQDRRDKEKDKRMKGQSTHASWKSEAEMALRQQYDS